MACPPCRSALLSPQRRREVSQGKIGGINFFGKFAVGFGFFLDALPLRVVLKGFPVSRCLFSTGMLEDVDQGVALLWFVNRCPVSDTFEPMPVKDFYGVIAEACQQVLQLCRRRVINPKFVDHGRAFLTSALLLRSGFPNNPAVGVVG